MEDENREFYHWYSPWDPPTPAAVADLLAGLGEPWWIVGGWAIVAFTGRSRQHEDIDVAFFKADLPVVLDHLLTGHCAWSNLSGTPSRCSARRYTGCTVQGWCGGRRRSRRPRPVP